MTLDSFAWLDPDDSGYEVEPFDPDRDTAPEGAEHDCAGEGDDGAS